MKIAHFADLHYSRENLAESDRCFGFAIETAIAQGVELGIVTGDCTDKPLESHSEEWIALFGRICQLADHCPVILLQGTFSHEPPGILRTLGMARARHPILVCDRLGMYGLYDGTWAVYDKDRENPSFVVSAIPTLNKAQMVAALGHDSGPGELGNQMAGVLASFAEANMYLMGQGIPTALISHGTVNGARNENGYALVNQDHEFSQSTLYSAAADAVMLGHIHQFQDWEHSFNGRTQRIAYSGSIGRFHYGEQGKKGFLIWDLEPGNPTFEMHCTPAREMVDITFDGIPDMDELAEMAGRCKGSYVRVRFSVDEEYAKTVDRKAIEEILTAADVAGMKIEGKILPVQRQRSAGIASLETLDEKFVRWCETSSTPQEGLLERLATLSADDPEDISRKIVQRYRKETAGEKAVVRPEPVPAPAVFPMNHENHELLFA